MVWPKIDISTTLNTCTVLYMLQDPAAPGVCPWVRSYSAGADRVEGQGEPGGQ